MSNENEFVASVNRLESLIDSNQTELKRDVESLIDRRFSSLKEEVNKLKCAQSALDQINNLMALWDDRRDLSDLPNRIRTILEGVTANNQQSHDLDELEVGDNVIVESANNLSESEIRTEHLNGLDTNVPPPSTINDQRYQRYHDFSIQMDHNLKPAIDEPSVSSHTSSLVQLEINPHSSTVGPINLLPSEMIQLILAKLRLDSNVKKLIRLRLVSTRWRAIVEDYCRQKKSLVVVPKSPLLDESVHALIRELFGFEYTKDYACLLLDPKLPSECLKSLLNIFPNIVDLYIRFGRTRVSDFVVYINSLDSLKQLDLDGKFLAALSSISGALSKSENISFGLDYNPCKSSLKDDDHHQLISHLGSSCVRVKFNQFTRFVCDQILQWHNLNPLWLANLTHLQFICTDCSSELKFVQVVQFLSEHAPLKFLSFEAGSMFINSLHLTPTVIHNLGKLTNLAELQLTNVKIDFLELQHTLPVLTSLSTVVSTKLVVYHSCDHRFSGDLCTRVLSAILPNLVDLELTVVFLYASFIRLSQHEIEQHLDRFPKLRKRKIEVRNW